MKIIDEAIELAYALFPIAYKEKERGVYRTFHWSFGYKRSRLIGIGQAEPAHINGRALTIAKKFGIHRYIKHSYLHSEIDLISRLWGRVYLDNSIRLINIRLNAKGELRNSKPCVNCQKVLDAIGISKIFYSVNGGMNE